MSSEIAPPVFAKPQPLAQQSRLFNIEAFDRDIAARGVQLCHYKHIPCPVGLVSRDDLRRPHADHAGCQNGFLFIFAGPVTCLFSGNSKHNEYLDTGILANSTVQATFPRTYDGTNQAVIVAPRDRLFLAEESIVVVQTEKVVYSGSGIDRVKYPIVCVEILIDSQNKSYTQDQDFTIQNGNIVWGPNSPGLEFNTGAGRVYTIRYLYRPYYIVDMLSHEIRVAAKWNATLGVKEVVPMPYAASLVREYAARTAENDPANTAPKSRQELSDNQENFYDADQSVLADQP